jgi:hypothetical protein
MTNLQLEEIIDHHIVGLDAELQHLKQDTYPSEDKRVRMISLCDQIILLHKLKVDMIFKN